MIGVSGNLNVKECTHDLCVEKGHASLESVDLGVKEGLYALPASRKMSIELDCVEKDGRTESVSCRLVSGLEGDLS